MTPQTWFAMMIGFSLWSATLGYFFGKSMQIREDFNERIRNIKK